MSGRARAFVWGFTPSSHAFAVTREDRRLVVVVSELPEGALTVAIESPRTADTDGLLAGRRVLAERTTLATGKRRGERFARAWLAGAPSARCAGANGKKRAGSR